jgi:predicted LPLAT superfamily acyltransferase
MTTAAWTGKAERGSAWLMHLIAWLARTVGRPLCRALLYPIVLYFVLTDRMARTASAEFLQAVRGRRSRWRDVFAHIYSFAATILDRVYMAAGDFDRFEVVIEGLHLVEQGLRANHGCLLLGSHLGSFDLLMLAHHKMDGRAINVMMHLDPRSKVRRIAGIDDGAMSVIPLGRVDSFLRAHEALGREAIVAVLADRVDSASQYLPARFLGRTVRLPIAPHVLAARSRASVVMCFGLYEGANRYRIEFVDFGPAEPAGSRGAQLQPAIDRYAALLEQYARRWPLNWFNFYPYWDDERGSTR